MGAGFDLFKGGFKNDWEPTTKGLSSDEVSKIDLFGLSQAAGGAKPPPDPPDATDELIRKRRAEEMYRLMLGVGRRSTFSEGGMGDLNLGRKALGGR